MGLRALRNLIPFNPDDASDEEVNPLGRQPLFRSESPASVSRIPAPAETSTPDPNDTPLMQRPMKPLETAPMPNALQPRQAAIQDAENQPLTFGTDSEGNTRYAPKKGLGHRVLAGLKAVGQGVESGEGAPLVNFIRGVSDPSLPAKNRYQRRVNEAQGEFNREASNEKDVAQIENLRSLPRQREDAMKERERDDIRGAWQAIVNSGQEFSPDNPEHKRMHDRAEAVGVTLPYGAKKKAGEEDREVGGRIVRKQPDGTYKPIYEPPVKAEKPDRTEIRGEEERARKRSAAEGELKSLGEEEEGARVEKERKQAALTALQSKPPSEVPADVLAAAEREAKSADDYYRGFADKKRKTQRDINENAPSAAPTLVTPEKPETRKGTISKSQQELWMSHNPGKTVEDMKRLYPNAVIIN